MIRSEWSVPFAKAYGNRVYLVQETYLCDQGYGKRPTIDPVTITRARFKGEIEGGEWLCFPCLPEAMSVTEGPWDGWAGDDEQCRLFWASADREGWLIGRGYDASDAYLSLIRVVCRKAALDWQDLYVTPQWPRGQV
jgi:hypothetical protein